VSTTTVPRGPATPDETGRACPYCRHLLRSGVDVVRCGECAATHHADCWDENKGCAIVACAGGPAPGAHGDDVPGKGKPGKGVPGKGVPVGKPLKVATPARRSWRGPVIGAGAGLAVIFAVVALAIAGGRDASSQAGSSGGPDGGGEPTLTAEPAVEPPSDPGMSEEDTVAAVADLLQRSTRGRRATMLAHDYDRANAIRASILSDLDDLDTVELSDVRSLLRRAMRASIKANQVRVQCPECVAPYDDTATALKQRLVDAYNPYAEQYGYETFSEGDI
jgi:hypothetical protein